MAIIYERKDHIARLTINRPEAANSLDIPTLVELDDACEDLHLDPDAWVMIVTGAGDKASAQSLSKLESCLNPLCLLKTPSVREIIDDFRPADVA